MRHYVRLILFVLISFFSLFSEASFANGVKESMIKKIIASRLGFEETVQSVVKTPYANLYEVRVGNDILYTDEKVKYIFVGQIQDIGTNFNYTQARLDEINRIEFSALPFNSALKIVNGDGSRVMAVFEDPNCGYCKKFDWTLKNLDNVTIYIFMYNILSEDSVTKSRNIWCSSDKVKAWQDWMLEGKVPPMSPKTCDSPNDKVTKFAKKWKIDGTPTLFFSDGSRVQGLMDAESLNAKLNSVKRVGAGS